MVVVGGRRRSSIASLEAGPTKGQTVHEWTWFRILFRISMDQRTRIETCHKRTMADPDIPVAIGMPIGVPARPSLAQAATGRSSRVSLTHIQQDSFTNRTVQSLHSQGFTEGLTEALLRNNRAFPLRIWVVDNSGSMNARDGHRLVETAKQKDVKLVDCTRWAEMQQTVEYHIQMAALTESPTVFRLLNDPGRVAGPQQFSVAEQGSSQLDADVARAQSTILNTSPGGVTPLIPHIHEIRDNVRALEPQLRAEGTKVVVVLATDGLPTNEMGMSDSLLQSQFVNALRELEGLPVWMVVRLCTDEDNVVEFWSELDKQLELSLEVLDDFSAEAAEVHACNPWLTYGLPLHRSTCDDGVVCVTMKTTMSSWMLSCVSHP